MGEKDEIKIIPKENIWTYRCGDLFTTEMKNDAFCVVRNIFIPKENLIRELSYEVFAEITIVNVGGEFSEDLNFSKEILMFIAKSNLNFSMAIYRD